MKGNNVIKNVKRFCSESCEFADTSPMGRKNCPNMDQIFCEILEDCIDREDPCHVEYGVYLGELAKKSKKKLS